MTSTMLKGKKYDSIIMVRASLKTITFRGFSSRGVCLDAGSLRLQNAIHKRISELSWKQKKHVLAI